MRFRTFLLILGFFLVNTNAKSACIISKGSQGNVPTDNRPMLTWFSNLTPKQYELLRGKKMNAVEKIVFKSYQRKIKHTLKKGGEDKQTTGINWGGLLLGTFLGPIGVIAAYAFSKDRNFRKWAWRGLLIFVSSALLVLSSILKQS